MKNNIAIIRYGLVLLCFLILSQVADAIPARPGVRQNLTLADGTVVNALLVGDEHGHYWLADDGNGYRVKDGIAEKVDIQTIQKSARRHKNESNSRRAQRLMRRSPAKAGIPDYTGKKKGLIILVNFSDVTFDEEHDKALYERIANEKGFKEGQFQGSVYDYFYAQSDGQFELSFDVVGPLTVSEAYSYYGENFGEDDADKHPAEMVIECLKLADSQVNYKDYDWDGDGEVDQVFLIYAGQNEAESGGSDCIWPHEWTLDAAKYVYGDGTGSQRLDGVKIDTYACGSELGYYGTIAGIGTICHEFSHCLGYPDFYDTDYSGGNGMFEWDIMDSGSYNGGGFLPAGYTGYERWVAGWKTPVELTDTAYVDSMKALQNGGEVYVIYNKGNQDEFYLLENRQKVGWDGAIPGAGLLILHVDYDEQAWADNEPNDDPEHQRMTWVAADNEYQYTMYGNDKYLTTEGAANDPFPYDSINAFNKNTTPAATFYNANEDGTYYLDASIEDITQNPDGTISFSFLPYKTKETGVGVIRIAEQEDVWYDLTGRRLKSAPTSPGIYIKSGRKVVL